MKRLLLSAVCVAMFFGVNVQASQPCQAECRAICNANIGIISTVASGISHFGHKIDNVDLPIIGKLGNLLPVGVITICLKKFPRQTMALVGLGFAYALYQNKTVKALFVDYCSECPLFAKKVKKQQVRSEVLNDSFFVFDEEDTLNGEEVEDMEDELLDYSLLEDDEYSDEYSYRTNK